MDKNKQINEMAQAVCDCYLPTLGMCRLDQKPCDCDCAIGRSVQTYCAVKEVIEKVRKYEIEQFHKYHEQRNEAEEKYRKCKEEQGKAVLNNDWHRADAIMFILEKIGIELNEIAKELGVEVEE